MRSIISFLVIIICFTSSFAQGPALEWHAQMPGPSYEAGRTVKTDSNGNVYTTGEFNISTDFDPGTGVSNLTSVGNTDLFVQKLDPNGNLLWVGQIGGTTEERVGSIAVDASDNVYTTGRFSGTVDFDPGSGIYNLSSIGSHDFFIQKLDPNGNLLWAKNIGGGTMTMGLAITTDASGNVYTTGFFGGTADFDTGSGVSNLTASGGYNIFIQKIDANGDFQWAKNIGSSGNQQGSSISLDASGNVYVSGKFQGVVDFDPGPGVTNLSFSGNSVYNIFTMKLTNNGQFEWAKRLGGRVEAYAFSKADHNGNLYTLGSFTGSVDFDPSSAAYVLNTSVFGNMYLQKLDTNGNFVWAKTIEGSGNTSGTAIDVDAHGNVYTHGSYRGTVDFDSGAGVHNLVNANGGAFVQKIDAAGNFDWVFENLAACGCFANSVHVTSNGNIYTTGNHSSLFYVKKFFNPSPSCVYAKDIQGHYCKPRVSQLNIPSVVHTSQIVIGVNPQGYIPTTSSCPATALDWTHFNIKTEALSSTGQVIAQKNTDNIPVGNLYSVSGSNLQFYTLPTSAVAPGPVSSNPFSSSNQYRLRVTITGVNTGFVSSHSSQYTMDVSSSNMYLCTMIAISDGPTRGTMMSPSPHLRENSEEKNSTDKKGKL